MKYISIFTRCAAFAAVLVISSGAYAQCAEVQVVIVTGYVDHTDPWLPSVADDYPKDPPPQGKPGSSYSAKPNSHVNCSSDKLSDELDKGTSSTKSQPGNTALPVPMRNANPIDISNGSPIGAKYGGVNGSGQFMVFPNVGAGTNAALASVGQYISLNYSVGDLLNKWAPTQTNPNTMNNMLSSLGITTSMANATPLSVLTATQLMQLIGAFAWQEGYKPSGC